MVNRSLQTLVLIFLLASIISLNNSCPMFPMRRAYDYREALANWFYWDPRDYLQMPQNLWVCTGEGYYRFPECARLDRRPWYADD